MADGKTQNYNLTLPEVGAATNTWGTSLNSNFTTIDNQLKALDTAILEVAGGGSIDLSGYVKKVGDAMSGPLILSGNPTVQFQAATKDYVDTNAITLAGSFTPMTGYMTLYGQAPINNYHPTPKIYVDSNFVKITGNTTTNPVGPLYLTTPSDSGADNQAATIKYVRDKITTSSGLTLAGNTSSTPMTGPIYLQGVNPVDDNQAVRKKYVDDNFFKLSSTNTTLSGNITHSLGTLILSQDPTNSSSSLQAATKGYVDGKFTSGTYVPLTGTAPGFPMTGYIVLAGDPTNSLHPATKSWSESNFLAKSGGTLTGALYLSGNPATSTQAATKDYVDTKANAYMPLTGGTFTAFPTLPSGQPSNNYDAVHKYYVDNTFAKLSAPTFTGTVTAGGFTASSGGTVSATNGSFSTVTVSTSVTSGSASNTLATKAYVDSATGNVATSLQKTGDTMTGYLTLNADPVNPLHAATRQWVITNYQPVDADLTAISAIAGTSGFLKKTGAGLWALDTSTYLTAMPSVTYSGDATGSGTTAVTLTLANSGVTAGTYNNSTTAVTPFTVDAKGRVTAIGGAVTIAPAFTSITGKPTTLAGYGITDALSASGSANISVVSGTLERTLTLGSSNGYFFGNATTAGWKTSSGVAALSITNSTGNVALSSALSVGGSTTLSGSTFAGTISCTTLTASTDIVLSSDARLKDDVRTVKEALSLVKRMRGVFFKWAHTGEESVGVIAQEMEQVIPQVVREADGHLSVAYQNIVGVLIEAVKELSARVEELETR